MPKSCFHFPNVWFLNLDDMVGMILCYEDCCVPCGVLINILGLYLIDVNTIPSPVQTVTTRNISRHFQTSPGRQNHPQLRSTCLTHFFQVTSTSMHPVSQETMNIILNSFHSFTLLLPPCGRDNPSPRLLSQCKPLLPLTNYSSQLTCLPTSKLTF